MLNRREAFTMIELIFVIIIIGVLAAVAIPRLAGTRDDAMVSKVSHSIQTARVEIMSQIVSKGVVPTTSLSGNDGLNRYSNMVEELSSIDSKSLIVVDGVSTISGKAIDFRVDNGRGAMETCTTLEINVTDMQIRNSSSIGAICRGVHSIVPSVTLPVQASRVTF